MVKYNYSLKKAVVTEYLNGNDGYYALAKKYGIKNDSVIIRWVKNYQNLGDEGLKRSRHNSQYSFEFKIKVVESYLTSEISYSDLALQHGMKNSCLICKWVNDYRIAGPDALRPRKKGRKKNMKKLKKSLKASKAQDNNAEYLKQLEEENLKLRIENAYLKELRRLRLANEAKMK